MASKSTSLFPQRASSHPNALVRRLFNIAEKKKTNIVLSADLTTTKDLLDIANSKSCKKSQLFASLEHDTTGTKGAMTDHLT